jgi:hypothetical protein
MLVSAFQRLTLYEEAYGFTRLRTYPHIFMIWLGLLLLALLALELSRRVRYFPALALAAGIGFTISMNAVNVDALIVRQNLAAAVAGNPLDVGYLTSLSDDAVPALVRAYQTAQNPEVRADLGGILACRAVTITNPGEQPWQAFNLSAYQAWQWLQPLDLTRYTVYRDEYGLWHVWANGQDRYCWSERWMD